MANARRWVYNTKINAKYVRASAGRSVCHQAKATLSIGDEKMASIKIKALLMLIMAINSGAVRIPESAHNLLFEDDGVGQLVAATVQIHGDVLSRGHVADRIAGLLDGGKRFGSTPRVAIAAGG